MAGITVKTVRQAGVVGAGGAGFPAHVKLSGRADTFILNAAECEPLLHKDKEVLRAYVDEVIAGFAAGMELVGAERGFIGIKEKYTDVIELVSSKLAGGMQVAELTDTYPAGDEFILTYDVTGRVIPPGGIPLNVGVVTMNVETALNVSASADRPVTIKHISVAGAVAEPVTLRVPVGISLSQCVAAAGGATIPDPNYVIGGVMMGRLESDFNSPVTKTTGGIIVLPTDHTVIRRFSRSWKVQVRIGLSACDQCNFCTERCPRYLLGHPIEPHRAMRSLGFNMVGEANVRGTVFCCECNLCSMFACPEDLDPKDICAQNKRRLAEEGAKWADPPFNPKRADMHLANRKAPIRHLMRRLDLMDFHNEGPLVEQEVEASRVGIALSQHIGAPCEPVVQVGRQVSRGELVGEVPNKNGKPALGAPVHASIDGKVVAIEDGVVWIEQ